VTRAPGEVWTFGTMPDGAPCRAVALAAHGLGAEFIEYGATLRLLTLEGTAHPLTLSLPSLEAYRTRGPHVGAMVGRVANRIAHARAPVDGRVATLDANAAGGHTLHGGAGGTGASLWTLRDRGPAQACFEIVQPDGWMGFPGRLRARLRARILPGPTLALTVTARADAPTLCAFAHHSYFNLDGGGDLSGHRLQADAARYLPVDEEGVPLDGPAPVAGSPLDFRAASAIPPEADHCLCLSDTPAPLRRVATLSAGGLAMDVLTTEPGLQVYAGANLRAGVGVALEPQRWPDAPNRPWAAQTALPAGAAYRQRTRLRFRRGVGDGA
jgi:aldose 1-epimerase